MKVCDIENKPWEMTKWEWAKKFNMERNIILDEKCVEQINEGRTWHKLIVEETLSNGGFVPAKVLKDYPDLMKKFKVKSLK